MLVANLTGLDMIRAAIGAIIVTWIIRKIAAMFSAVVSRSAVFNYPQNEFEAVLKRCCGLFPTDMLRFKDQILYRGMTVRARTMEDKTIEGRFIGTNHENMVCFITPQYVIAHELAKIADIIILMEIPRA